MGIVEIQERIIIISSHILTYGNASSPVLAERIREEIGRMWNEPQALIAFGSDHYRVQFNITAEHRDDLSETDVLGNVDPRNNYFRIEEFALGNISFVDGLGCNTGYFMLENLYEGSTTAAHEYGHTLGLDHPTVLDIRGKGIPGIMYPRGTLVDPQYQYEPDKTPGTKGGTLHPMYRKVLTEDIESLNLQSYLSRKKEPVLGEFSSVWHNDHREFQQNA